MMTTLASHSKRIGGTTGRIAKASWPWRLIVALLVAVTCVPLEARAQPARRGWLGLAGQDLDHGGGVIVVDLQPGSPAASAGLRIGDRLTAVNGRPIRSIAELGNWVTTLVPGTALRFSVRRGTRVGEVAVTLGALPTPGYTRPTNPPRTGPTAPAPSRSSEWSCRAVGTYAPASSNGGPDYSDKQNVDISKWGATRDTAAWSAYEACADLLHLSANPTLSPGSLVLEECRVISARADRTGELTKARSRGAIQFPPCRSGIGRASIRSCTRRSRIAGRTTPHQVTPENRRLVRVRGVCGAVASVGEFDAVAGLAGARSR